MSKRKKSCTKSQNSKTPSHSVSISQSANHQLGENMVNKNLRSVLSHPLALPLLWALHGRDLSTLTYLSKESTFGNADTAFDNIFEDSVNAWQSNNESKGRTEKELTKLVSAKFDADRNNISITSKNEAYTKSGKEKRGYIDIIFSPKTADGDADADADKAPLAIFEFGVGHKNWWKKLDQCRKYWSIKNNDLIFNKPFLMVILTIEVYKEDFTEDMTVKLGTFLCSPKASKTDEAQVSSDYRLSLLRHSYSTGLTEASKEFGRLMRATSDFNRWRGESTSTNQDDSDNYSWSYLGPNCCKVKTNIIGEGGTSIYKVLRSYDTRLRTSERTSVIYDKYKTQEESKMAKEVFTIEPQAEDENDPHELWKKSGKLRVIETPFREGRHYAENPREFVRIISELEKLQKQGFVHGDIRGFNTVFSSDHDKGWLIDFDFGGPTNTTVYPQGYKRYLNDGWRMGSGGEKITEWHDFHALIRLLFMFHMFIKPASSTDENLEMRYLRADKEWKEVETSPTTAEMAGMIKKLKDLLSDLDKEGWTLKPSITFQKDLNECDKAITDPNATGSPQKQSR